MARRGKLGNAPGSDIHLTPPEIWERLHKVHPGPWFDPCPHPRPEHDGLEVAWPADSPTYVNPPFSDLEGWAERCAREGWRPLRKVPLVVLVPVRTSQPYWTRLMRAASCVAFWTGDKDRPHGTLPRRVRFLGPDGTRQAGAPFDTALFLLTGWHMNTFTTAFTDVATVSLVAWAAAA